MWIFQRSYNIIEICIWIWKKRGWKIWTWKWVWRMRNHRRKTKIKQLLQESGLKTKILNTSYLWITTKIFSFPNKKESIYLIYLDLSEFSNIYPNFSKQELLNNVEVISRNSSKNTKRSPKSGRTFATSQENASTTESCKIMPNLLTIPGSWSKLSCFRKTILPRVWRKLPSRQILCFQKWRNWNWIKPKEASKHHRIFSLYFGGRFQICANFNQ